MTRGFSEIFRLDDSSEPPFSPIEVRAVVGLTSAIQAEMWGTPPYPPRTMMEIQRLFEDDIVEIDTVFYAPLKK